MTSMPDFKRPGCQVISGIPALQEFLKQHVRAGTEMLRWLADLNAGTQKQRNSPSCLRHYGVPIVADAFDILVWGKFAELKFGDDLSAVRAVFGEPDLFEPARKSRPDFVLYGPVEFRLHDGKLRYVGVKLYQEVAPRTDIVMRLEQVKQLRRSTYLGLLDQNGIEFKFDKYLTGEDQVNVITEFGVHAAFNGEGELQMFAMVDTAIREYDFF